MFARYSSLSPTKQRLLRIFGVILLITLVIAACLSVIMKQHRADLQKLDLWLGDTNVAMYTTSSCSYCQAARLYFAENNIEFTEFNIEHSNERYEQFVELGGSGTPLMYVDKKRMDGFNVNQFEQLYSP